MVVEIGDKRIDMSMATKIKNITNSLRESVDALYSANLAFVGISFSSLITTPTCQLVFFSTSLTSSFLNLKGWQSAGG